MRLYGPQTVIGVSSIDAYRARVTRAARKRGLAVTEDSRTLEARVDDGRWVADCPQCHAGIAIHPEWPFAACLDCAHTFTRIALPADYQEIEMALERRPTVHQHWRSPETPADVRADNRRHGVV